MTNLILLAGMILLMWSGVRAMAAEGEGQRSVFEISTARSMITFAVGSDHRLYQLGYGSRQKKPEIPEKLPMPAYDGAAERLSEVYPSFGNGYLLEPALHVTHADGDTSTDLKYVSHTVTEDAGIATTRIELKDPKHPFQVTLVYRAYVELDIIEQFTEIRHDESRAVTMHRYASASPVFRAKSYWLTQLQGYHMREAGLVEEKLTPGVKLLDSKLGVRAHQIRTPGFFLSLDQSANEESGEVFAGSLAWAGSYAFAFDLDFNNGLRAVCGINPHGSQYHLQPGRTFTTPAMIWAWSDRGKGQISRNFHRWARQYSLRESHKPRPVLLNNWEATFFNFDEAKLVSLLDGAREIGSDVFLLDDGWFGRKYPRNDDRQGLGDWMVNEKKLPHGLSYLVEQSKQRGIDFGIWVEPEMVSPKSELYEAHPDWALQQTGREMILGRWQRVLDLNRPEVKEFVFNVIDKTLKDAPGTRYVKWDCNAYALQPGSTWLKPEEQSHALVDYQFAVYDVMRKVVEAHPDVMMMLCSSGPARSDFASLKNFHSFWASDNTDPLKRVFIQWGFSHFYPAQSMNAHVTDFGHRPLKFACDVALSGAFGVDMDLSKRSDEERKQLAKTIKLYKEVLRDLIAEADLYRVESPYDHPRSVIQYVAQDRTASVVFVYQVKNAESGPVCLKGLDSGRRYRVTELNLPEGTKSSLKENGQVVDGKSLMDSGILPPCNQELQSVVIHLRAE